MLSKIKSSLRKLNRWRKGLWPKPPKLKFWYAWYYKMLPVKKNRVLFESFHGKDLSDSPYYILKAMMNAGIAKDYEIYFATINRQEHQKIVEQLGLPVKLVDVTTFRYTRILATSKYLINNSSFPVYFIRRPSQVYLQTWHGTPLKTLGREMRLGMESMYNIQHNFLHANYLMFPNEFTKNAMMRDYNLEQLYTGETVISGYPRNSIFCDKDSAKEVRSRLGLEQYQVFAYMPTWRGQSNHDVLADEQNVEIREILGSLDESLRDDQKLYVNFHPIVASVVHLDDYKHILPFPEGVDKYEFLNAVDALITDYSSVMFDFSITRKPVILFMYDYEQYMQDRGMYLDVRTLPFLQAYDMDALQELLRTDAWKENDYANDQDYIGRFIPCDSLDAGEKMMRLVLEGKREGMTFESYAKNREREWQIFWPKNCKTIPAIDGVARTTDPDRELVVFEMKRFSPVTSAHLYDNYKDAFVYMFMVNAYPRTVLEWCFRFIPFVKRVVHNRNVRRCFPDLKVSPEFRTEYYHGQAGERFYYEEKPCLEADLEVTDDKLKIQVLDQVLTAAHPKNMLSGGKITKLFVLDNSLMLWSRELSPQEQKSRCILENFKGVLENSLLKKGRAYQLGLEVQEKNGERQLFHLQDGAHFYRAMQAAGKTNKSAYSFPVIPVGEQVLKGKGKAEKVVVLPFLQEKGENLHILVTSPEEVTGRFRRADVKSIRTRGSRLLLRVNFEEDALSFRRVEFKFRNTLQEMVYELPCKVERKGGQCLVRVDADMNAYHLDPIYWDLHVILGDGEREERIPCTLSALQFKLLKVRLVQCSVSGGYILFPYRRKLAFMYKERTPNDGWIGRSKELFAILVYDLSQSYWKKRRIWLVYEKFCYVAQDNGYYFFKYCMDMLPEEERRHIYYVLDKKSPDWEKMSVYGNQIVPFMSFRHLLYTLAARVYIASESRKHLYLWRAKPNRMEGRQMKRPLFFLQHGVTALKRVHEFFGSRSNGRVSFFGVTSEFEQNIIKEYFGYPENRIPITGFCRWDVLEDHADPENRMILVMPTWRMWLEDNTEDEFIHSTYYENYSGLLSDERLLQVLETSHTKLIFYIHPKLAENLQSFRVNSKQIQLIPFGDQPLNEIIMRCHMLVTDYSSVCWEALYLEKPVLFFQFDRDDYVTAHGGGYIDFDTQLFGDVFRDRDALIDGISACVENGFREKPEYAAMRPGYFAYRDNQNSRRTYRFLVENGF